MDTIEKLAAKLDQEEASAVELAVQAVEKAKKLQKDYNAFVTIVADDAIEQAKSADQARKEGGQHLLNGIPYAAKDIFCTEGVLTTCASKILNNFIAPYDATAIKQLKEKHSVLIGKTNMDEFAMGSSNEHSLYGEASNPWDPSRVPGGSSGGSAIAVATRIVPYALGTDTGGSVRQPAAFCGILGFKPTYGRVSRYGMIAYGSSLDQAGVFAHNVADVAIVLNEICGVDEKDSTSADIEVPDFRSYKEIDLSNIKVGVVKEFFTRLEDKSMHEALDQAIECFNRQGITVQQISLPNVLHSIPCYYTIALAEASANLARYDGVRYGFRAKEVSSVEELFHQSRSQGFGTEVKKRILLGTYVLTSGYYDAYYLKAQQVRRLIRQDFIEAFKQVDVILGPVTPSFAFKKGEQVDSLSMYLQDIYTVPANLAGLPAMSVPIGFVNNLPVAMQLISNYFAEETILALADCYQGVTDWHQRTPPVQ